MEKLQPNLATAPAPKIYMHQQEEHYLDIWQKRFVPINDFQTLKQYIGTYLVTTLTVPTTMIQSAMPFRTYRIPSERVGDFVVEYYRQGKLKPLIYVRCSNQHQELLPSMYIKAHESAMELGSRYLLLTNGTTVYFAQLNQLGTDYEPCELQPYAQLIPEKAGLQEQTKPFVRQNLEQLQQSEYLRQLDYEQDWYTIGASVKDELVPVVVNLAEALFDSQSHFSPLTQQAVTLVQDLGLRELRESHIQGVAPAGHYRTLLIHDQAGNYQIASFLVAVATIGNKQTTALYCLFDDERESYQVLQLDLNRSADLNRETEEYVLWHNGRLAKRRDEKMITEALLAKIAEESPDLLVDGRIRFAALPTNCLLQGETPELQHVILQLLNYSQIREYYLR